MRFPIPTIIVERSFGAGKQVPLVFPTSPDSVVLPAFSTTEAAFEFCQCMGEGVLSPAYLTLSGLADHLQQWIAHEPYDGLKLLAFDVPVPLPDRFRAATMADTVAAIRRGETAVETATYSFIEAEQPLSEAQV